MVLLTGPLTAPQRAQEAQRDTHPPLHHEEHRGAGRQGTRAQVTRPTQQAQTKSTNTRGRREEEYWVGWDSGVWVVGVHHVIHESIAKSMPMRIPTPPGRGGVSFLPLAAHRRSPAANRPKDRLTNLWFGEYIAERNSAFESFFPPLTVPFK